MYEVNIIWHHHWTMGQHTRKQILSLRVIGFVYFARNISVSASKNQIVIAILHQPNTTNWTCVQIEHVLIRLMIIISNAVFSSVPFVEFNTKYYGYSPLCFADSSRINKITHANISESSYVQRYNCMTIIRNALSELNGLKCYFLFAFRKKSQGVFFLHVATKIV